MDRWLFFILGKGGDTCATQPSCLQHFSIEIGRFLELRDVRGDSMNSRKHVNQFADNPLREICALLDGSSLHDVREHVDEVFLSPADGVNRERIDPDLDIRLLEQSRGVHCVMQSRKDLFLTALSQYSLRAINHEVRHVVSRILILGKGDLRRATTQSSRRQTEIGMLPSVRGGTW